jgi:hypothetical protein
LSRRVEVQPQPKILPADSKLLRNLLILLKLITISICCFVYSLLCSCTGVKIPLGSDGTYYERTSDEEFMENHRNPQRMADKLEAEQQIKTKETIDRLINNDELSRENKLNIIIDRSLGRP